MALLERRRGLRRRAACGLPRRDRGARRRAPLLPAHLRGAEWRRHPDRAQGRHLHEGDRDDGGLEDPQRVHARVRRDGRSAREGRRALPPRQDEHGRVRHGLVDRELGVGADAEPVGSVARSGRLGWRHRCGGLGRPRAVGPRLRHGRLDQAAVRAVRERGPAADVRDGLALRRRRVRVEPRPDRAGREDRARRRAPLLDRRRSRPARLDDRGAARARAAAGGRLARRGPARGAEAGGGARRDRARRAGGVRAVARARARARRRGGGVRPAALVPLRDAVLLPRRACRGVVEPRALRRRPLRAACRRGDVRRDGRSHARRGLRPRAEAPHHARHVRAGCRVLRRVLRPGAEGANAAHPRASRRARRRRRDRHADLADRRVPDRRQGRRSARDVRLRPPDDPVLPRRAPRPLDPVRAVGRAAGRVCSSSGGSSARTGSSASGTHSSRRIGFDTVPERLR